MDRASVEPPARDIFLGGRVCGAGRDDVGIVPYGGDKKGGRIATALCASQ